MKKRVRSGSHGGYLDVSGFNNRTEVVIDDALVTEALKLFSLPTLLHSVVTDAEERFARSLQIQCMPGDPYDIFLRRKEHRVTLLCFYKSKLTTRS